MTITVALANIAGLLVAVSFVAVVVGLLVDADYRDGRVWRRRWWVGATVFLGAALLVGILAILSAVPGIPVGDIVTWAWVLFVLGALAFFLLRD